MVTGMTTLITQVLWHAKMEMLFIFSSSWQVVSPTGTVTYDVYAR